MAIGLARGFVRSFLSVASWILSAWITWRFAEYVVQFLEPMNISTGLQRPVAYVGLFFLSLLIASIISALIANSFLSPGFASVDRTLGAAFGILRGVLVILVLLMIGSMTVYVAELWWRNSIAVNIFEPWVNSIRDWLSSILNTGSVDPASATPENT